ncbi:hypothetical protein PR001_g14108 [Phytophthora rubi]|uniref:Uncharacterized protein n=1 Tax=Phytophthora rubi TaxID=129364 RepID=A0A6A3L3X6_9STRA|nr:hypothetical protein PR002_g14753 [Phytophthora rubi]KAE9018539.1 hypothetical protein PR001_g14108 [Phytophthora rubi]
MVVPRALDFRVSLRPTRGRDQDTRQPDRAFHCCRPSAALLLYKDRSWQHPVLLQGGGQYALEEKVEEGVDVTREVSRVQGGKTCPASAASAKMKGAAASLENFAKKTHESNAWYNLDAPVWLFGQTVQLT